MGPKQPVSKQSLSSAGWETVKGAWRPHARWVCTCKKRRAAHLADANRRNPPARDPVADPAHLDQELDLVVAAHGPGQRDPCPSNEPIKRRPPAAATARENGALARWHRARARASARSGGVGLLRQVEERLHHALNLGPPGAPHPATACLTSLGLYWTTGTPPQRPQPGQTAGLPHGHGRAGVVWTGSSPPRRPQVTAAL